MLNRNIVQSIQYAPPQQPCQLWLPPAASLATQSSLHLLLPASALWTSMHKASQSLHAGSAQAGSPPASEQPSRGLSHATLMQPPYTKPNQACTVGLACLSTSASTLNAGMHRTGPSQHATLPRPRRAWLLHPSNQGTSRAQFHCQWVPAAMHTTHRSSQHPTWVCACPGRRPAPGACSACGTRSGTSRPRQACGQPWSCRRRLSGASAPRSWTARASARPRSTCRRARRPRSSWPPRLRSRTPSTAPQVLPPCSPQPAGWL